MVAADGRGGFVVHLAGIGIAGSVVALQTSVSGRFDSTVGQHSETQRIR
jgi:hypothetical protein